MRIRGVGYYTNNIKEINGILATSKLFTQDILRWMGIIAFALLPNVQYNLFSLL